MNTDPAAYVPTNPDQFLGPARTIALMLEKKADALLAPGNPAMQFRVEAPGTEEIAEFLSKRWGFPKQRALEIAVGSGSNCRAALLDAQSILDVQRISA